MNLMFNIVYQMLLAISEWTGLSYEAVNVIVWYAFIPLAFCALVDRILRRPICTVSFGVALVAVVVAIPDFNAFCDRLFLRSVEFLEGFSRVGMGYCTASVVVCVFAPLAVFAVLTVFAFPVLVEKHFPTVHKAKQHLVMRARRTHG